jgi:hypothetical protein
MKTPDAHTCTGVLWRFRTRAAANLGIARYVVCRAVFLAPFPPRQVCASRLDQAKVHQEARWKKKREERTSSVRPKHEPFMVRLAGHSRIKAGFEVLVILGAPWTPEQVAYVAVSCVSRLHIALQRQYAVYGVGCMDCRRSASCNVPFAYDNTIPGQVGTLVTELCQGFLRLFHLSLLSQGTLDWIHARLCR